MATRTLYYTAASVDGFIADTEATLDWLMQFGETAEGGYPAFIADVGALVMGSVTYEWILKHQNQPGADHPQPWPYTMPAWIMTTRELPGIEGADIRFASGDVKAVHEQMVEAANGKNVWVVGGGELAAQFYDRGLLDEMIVTVTSVTLGTGAPLFPRAITIPPMKLISTTQYGSPFVELHYELPPPQHT